MVIDSHTHLLGPGEWPQEWWDHVAIDWAARAPGRQPSDIRDRIELGLVDLDGRAMLAAMDEAGVAAAVLLAWDWGPDYRTKTSVWQMNARTAGLAGRHPHRFIPFFGVDPRRTGAVEAFEAALHAGEAFGLKLYPSCGFDVDEATGLYQACVDHDVPVLVHTGAPLPLLPELPSRPALLRRVVREFPRLRLWVGHAGAPCSWDEALTLAATSDVACLEISAWLWDDSTDADVEAMVRRLCTAKNEIGIERVLFGSDHVSGRRVRGPSFMRQVTDLYRGVPAVAERLSFDLDDRDLAKVMGANALRELHVWTARHHPAELHDH